MGSARGFKLKNTFIKLWDTKTADNKQTMLQVRGCGLFWGGLVGCLGARCVAVGGQGGGRGSYCCTGSIDFCGSQFLSCCVPQHPNTTLTRVHHTTHKPTYENCLLPQRLMFFIQTQTHTGCCAAGDAAAAG